MIKFSVILIISFITLSCASGPREYREIDIAVERHDFTEAIGVLERGQRRSRPVYSERNSILLHLNRGFLEYYAGNYEASSNALQTAEKLIEEAYTKSITQGFLSYILNDNTKEYPGEDFEDIYINVFNALNYYNRGNIEGALVEIRKLTLPNGKLDMLARKYEYIDPNTGASLEDIVARETGVSQLPQTKSVDFSNSALARYLGALFYQADGNFDSARIEFDQVRRAFTTNKAIYNFDFPSAVEEAYNVPAGKARLNIISFVGLSPIKEEQVILQQLPFQHPIISIAAFKLPVLVKRPGVINRIEVIIDGTQGFELELLEDIGSVIEETYNARFSNIFTKTYIRTIIKYAVADVAAMAASDEDILAGLLVAIGARVAADLSENADTRMSRFLPDKAYIGGIDIDPGTYSVIINYYDGNRLIATDERSEFTVNLNRLNLLQSVKLR